MQEVIGSDGKSIFRLDYELEQMDVLPQEDYFKNTPISIFTSDVSSLSSLYQIR
jgi:outer membrane lipoprotein-sorting protein